MTGRELIFYILENKLEDKEAFENIFMTELQAAVKFGVGESTIRVWSARGLLPYVKVGQEKLYFRNAIDPRKLEDKHES